MKSSCEKKKKEKLQTMCRKYLSYLSDVAKRYGLTAYLKNLSDSNQRGECVAEEKDVELLARIAENDRILRTDIPPVFGVSYRECVDKDLFYRIRRMEQRGTYSRVSAEMQAIEYQHNG